MGNDVVNLKDIENIDKTAKKLISSKSKFERLVLTKEEALKLFKHNVFKTELIKNKVGDNSLTSAYRCGDFIDLCMGPHLPDTGKVKAFKANKISASYWLGKNNNDTLQRV